MSGNALEDADAQHVSKSIHGVRSFTGAMVKVSKSESIIVYSHATICWELSVSLT